MKSTIRLAFGLSSLFFKFAISAVPYNPTRLYISSHNGSEIVYAITPALSSGSSFELLALNATESMNASALPYKEISSSLPFLDNGNDVNVSFIPSVDDRGVISIFSGNCTAGAEGSSIWRYIPSSTSGTDPGTWVMDSVNPKAAQGLGKLTGANFLSAAITYSSTVDADDPSMYVFGGMCPNSSYPGSGQSAADYSNNMVILSPKTSDASSDSVQYDEDIASSRDLPIAEAGFTITPLPPSFTNTSSGTRSKQQDFVLVGGHTKSAFINMSQVALFSLPQEGWTFIAVNSPSVDAETDLSVRDSVVVEPRSGHTATLTSDGQRIIVFGGWVGDTNTPADPQLAILSIGEEYGGAGNWAWEIPSASGNGLGTGVGLYGHGAVMLPGDVMMVVGGYPISTKTGRRDVSPTENTNSYFLNVTSMEWISSYTPPAQARPKNPESSKTTGHFSTSKKAGLGVGVALGVIVAIILAFLCLICCRRRQRRRNARKRELEDFMRGTRYMPFVGSSVAGGFDGRGGQAYIPPAMEQQRNIMLDAAYPWANQPHEGAFGGGSGWRENRGTDVERTGLLLDIPSPTRGLRRNMHSRASHQSASWHEDKRKSQGSSGIHPIQERDEEEMAPGTADSAMSASGLLESSDPGIIATAPVLDPFGDPAPLGSHPIINRASPTDFERRRDIEGWVSDWAAADTILLNPGRASPDKSDRTSSTLSDQSAHSVNSVHSHLASSLGRSVSVRSNGIFSRGNTFSSHSTSPTFDRSFGRVSPTFNRRTQSLSYAQRPEASKTNDSFTTAQTSFSLLQTEGEALLGEHRPDHYDHSWSDAPNKSSRRTGWMGSMRRALPFIGGNGESSSSSGGDNSDRSNSLQSLGGGRYSPAKNHQPPRYHDHEDNVQSNPLLPRRAASASAALWQQRRQGAADWDVDIPRRRTSHALGTNRHTLWDETGEENDDEEWDIEAAVERRVVQVMFTVPREKLRVVNADSDGLSVSEVGEPSSSTAPAEMSESKGKGKAET
ncbi:hypothetical protein L228DRAFT_244728 [Xylona heveae TC161]|uniref:Galactose oxidase n=1 Tax=Xylona heveae (strain CBS 132557 / TC161) TaxID=1328760 RepID=A0A165J6K1_XYLHT|nr:hypothetical protein L228DRAFT_244728 [Xylona heveae TC161]KZF25803.1 hypothetical protein L228DRAFT_244728 [Xylona heveae TC161]